MRKAIVRVCFRVLLSSLLFPVLMISTQAMRAQAPAAGAPVAVRMMEAVDSAKDPAGKQYRASVTNAVDAGGGVVIPQGAAALVTLVNGGSGWTTQLVSVTINGQPVAVSSSPASVTSSAQNAASRTISSVNSMLGGFGHHLNAPSGLTAVAMGQRVVLPLGATLSFVLSQPPASSAAAAAVPASQPLTASAGPAPNPASGLATASAAATAGGPLRAMEICFSNPPPNPSDPNHKKEYLTAVFEFPIDTLHAVPEREPAFAAYLKATYQYPGARITCQPIWTVADARAAQKKIATDHAPNVKLIDTGWRYGQPPVAQGQSGFDPLTQGPGGLDLSQHRLTTYYCSLTAPGGTSMAEDRSKPNWTADKTTYVSPVFQADWNWDPVSMAYNVYIRDHYVHDLDPANSSPRCSADHPAIQAMQHQSAMISDKRIGHAVAVDFTDTPAQGAAGDTAAAAAHTASAAAAAALGPNQSYAFCNSDASAPVVYFSDIFVASTPPNGGHCGNCAAQRNSEYATSASFQTFLKEKYSFNGPASCRTGISAPALKAAQAMKQSMEDTARRGKAQVFETGWKNMP